MTVERVGRTAELSRAVGPDDTAAAWGDSFPPAASTPFVLGLAELACHAVVAGELEDGQLTVGTEARIEHLRASPAGATLVARARLEHADGRRLRFAVEVHDAGRLVARVDHSRAIVARAAILTALETA